MVLLLTITSCSHNSQHSPIIVLKSWLLWVHIIVKWMELCVSGFLGNCVNNLLSTSIRLSPFIPAEEHCVFDFLEGGVHIVNPTTPLHLTSCKISFNALAIVAVSAAEYWRVCL